MKINKNKNFKMGNENTNANDIADPIQTRDRLHNPSLNSIPTRNYEPFDFEINQEFIEENKKINLNLVRHRQNHKHKFAPFTKSQRRKRRMEKKKMLWLLYLASLYFSYFNYFNWFGSYWIFRFASCSYS